MSARSNINIIDEHSGEEHEVLRRLFILRPRSEYHEDFGIVLWWRLPVQEPPLVGMNMDNEVGALEDYPDGPTHWSPLPDPRFMTASDNAEIHR